MDKYLVSKYEAAKSIKTLLEQIDFSAEVVPENNLDMYSRLIASLKQEELTEEENRIIKEIVEA